MRSQEEQQGQEFEVGDPLGQWTRVPSNWSKTTLWDLAKYINGRAFKPSDFSKVGLQVIKITELKYGVSRDTTQYEGYYEEKHLLRKDDLLFAWSGNPETSLDVFWWCDGKALINQHIFRVIPRDGIDKRYLFYLFKFLRATFIRTARDKATSMGHVKVSDLKRLVAFIPPQEEQRAIAEVLGALDDKIELNRRMNEALEAMARAIFKSWFVDFDPVRAKAEGRQPYGMDAATAALFPDSFEDSSLGKIPKGWQAKNIGQLFSYVIGGDWGEEKESDAFAVPVVIIRGTDFPRIHDCQDQSLPRRFVAQERFERRKLKHGDLLLEISGGSPNHPTGRSLLIMQGIIGRLGDQVVPASFCRLIRPWSEAQSYFLALYLADLYDRGGTWNYQNQSTGISNFQFEYFATHELLACPSAERIFERFARHIRPLYQKKDQNAVENRALIAIRDALLPKLVSGEIRVKGSE